MAKTGSKQKSNLKDLAVHEYFTAIQQFADAMEAADIGYIAKTFATYPMTLNMSTAFARYVEACRRLRDLA